MQMHQALTIEQPIEEAMTESMAREGKDIVFGGATAAIFTIIGGLLWLRRKLSRDNLEVKRDKGEGSLLQIVISERNTAMADAREAWAQRAKDAEMIGKLTAEVYMLRTLTERQDREISLLREEVHSMRAIVNEMRGKP